MLYYRHAMLTVLFLQGLIKHIGHSGMLKFMLSESLIFQFFLLCTTLLIQYLRSSWPEFKLRDTCLFSQQQIYLSTVIQQSQLIEEKLCFSIFQLCTTPLIQYLRSSWPEFKLRHTCSFSQQQIYLSTVIQRSQLSLVNPCDAIAFSTKLTDDPSKGKQLA